MSYSVSRTVRIPVQIADARPDWEGKYYEGTSELEDYRDAISFLPMQNFQPSVSDHLEAELQAVALRLPTPPRSIRVKITSFRFVFDQRQRQYALHLANKEQETEEAREQAERDARMFPDEDKDEASLQSKAVGYVAGGIIKFFWKETVKGARRAARSQKVQIKVPEVISKEYSEGITCELAGEVVFEWEDHESPALRVSGLGVYPEPPPEEPYPPTAVADTVQGAIRDCVAQCSQQLQAPVSK